MVSSVTSQSHQVAVQPTPAVSSSDLNSDLTQLAKLLQELKSDPTLANSSSFTKEVDQAMQKLIGDYSQASPSDKKALMPVLNDLKAAGLLDFPSGNPPSSIYSGYQSLPELQTDLQNLSSDDNKPFLSMLIGDLQTAAIPN